MNKIRTTGIIKETIYSEQGNAMYIVDIQLNGKAIKAQSINYSSKTKTLPDGKEVIVDYWETKKGNKMVNILNENIIACKDDMGSELRMLAGFGVIIILVILFFVIKG